MINLDAIILLLLAEAVAVGLWHSFCARQARHPQRPTRPASRTGDDPAPPPGPVL